MFMFMVKQSFQGIFILLTPIYFDSFSINMTPNRNASKDISEQVGAKRPKHNHKDDPKNILHSRYKQLIFVVNTGSASYSGSVLMPADSVHVCLNELADIMIDKML